MAARTACLAGGIITKTLTHLKAKEEQVPLNQQEQQATHLSTSILYNSWQDQGEYTAMDTSDGTNPIVGKNVGIEPAHGHSSDGQPLAGEPPDGQLRYGQPADGHNADGKGGWSIIPWVAGLGIGQSFIGQLSHVEPFHGLLIDIPTAMESSDGVCSPKPQDGQPSGGQPDDGQIAVGHDAFAQAAAGYPSHGQPLHGPHMEYIGPKPQNGQHSAGQPDDGQEAFVQAAAGHPSHAQGLCPSFHGPHMEDGHSRQTAFEEKHVQICENIPAAPLQIVNPALTVPNEVFLHVQFPVDTENALSIVLSPASQSAVDEDLPQEEPSLNHLLDISDSSPPHERQQHFPSIKEQQLLEFCRVNHNSCLGNLLLYTPPEGYQLFHETLSACLKVKHLTACHFEFDNEFLLTLATPQEWISTLETGT